MDPELDTGPRYQPEFSLGERLARLESIVDGLDGRFEESEKLRDEKIQGLRKELAAVNTAQKDAVIKAEIATDRRLELIGLQIEADRKASADRLGALERNASTGRGLREGAAELKASTVAVLGVIAALLLVILYVVHP